MWCIGIDEAGLGPVLGPMGVVTVGVAATDHAAVATAFEAAGWAIADSKRIHRCGDLSGLERVVLPALDWLVGYRPRSAAELFALLDETPDQRNAPWMAGADELLLPVSTVEADGRLPADVAPACFAGRLIHPARFNAARRDGCNRAALEWQVIAELLGTLPAGQDCDILVDRLGGRKFYVDSLTALWPDMRWNLIEEAPVQSRYQGDRCGASLTIAFAVGGESRSVCTALASCIAKYARELHMLLFNNYWCRRFPWLRPTAGYPQDARRWLYQVGAGTVAAFAEELVRGDPPALATPT